MTAHVDQYLPELALGTLAPERAAEVHSHLSECERCTGELRDTADALSLLAVELTPAPAPPLALRERLLGQIETRDRFLPFLDRCAKMFDLAVEKTREHLAAAFDPAKLEELLPGVLYRDFAGGPALGEAHAGVVRMQPGTVFPSHGHTGEERTLVLAGQLRDEQDREYGPGDQIVMADGSAHELRAAGDEEAVYVSVVVGISIISDDDDELEDF